MVSLKSTSHMSLAVRFSSIESPSKAKALSTESAQGWQHAFATAGAIRSAISRRRLLRPWACRPANAAHVGLHTDCTLTQA